MTYAPNSSVLWVGIQILQRCDMTLEEEKQWWYEMVNDLRGVMTIASLAEAIGVTERTVCNWQNGERPMGLKAIKVYLLHVKHCSALHRNPLPSNSQGNV